MDMSYTFCDGISKLVPAKPGMSYTLQYPPDPKKDGDKNNYALELEPMLYERVRKEEDVRTAHRDGAEARRHDAQHRHARGRAC